MPKRLLKPSICAATLLLLACALYVSAASASTTKTTTTTQVRPTLQSVRINRQAPLTLGISNSNSTPTDLESSNAARNRKWAMRARRIGTQMVRIAVFWNQIAPGTLPLPTPTTTTTTTPTGTSTTTTSTTTTTTSTSFVPTDPSSPGYNWTALDQQVRAVAGEGFQILLTVNNAPGWAEGAHMPKWAQPGSWKPNAKDFGQFATALATRYSGFFPDPLHKGKKLPRVRFYQAWNEPNMSYYITPQYKDEGAGAMHSGRSCPVKDTSALESPGIYRNLLNAFYASVKTVDPSDTVVSASVDPFSSPNCQPRMDNYRVAALRFDQALFCVNAKNRPLSHCSNPAHLDAFAANPYEPWTIPGPCGRIECGPTWSAPDGDVSIADVTKLNAALTAAVRAGKVLPHRKKGGFVTEVGWDQKPVAKREGVSQATAALWQEQTYYMLAHSGVTNVLWWQLADTSPFDGWPDASGEYLASGKPKPSATAYRFPFVTNRLTPGTVQLWGRAPRAGTMTIQELYQGNWLPVARFHVTAQEVFQGDLKLTGAASLRATVGGTSSLTWKQTATGSLTTSASGSPTTSTSG
jgi:hypothetical protein